jgi:exosortase/archaeosortase family protein
MKFASQIASTWLNIPVLVRSFLTRAIVVFIIWKLLYHVLLFPIRIPDKDLTGLTATSTTLLYRNLLNEPLVVSREETKGNIAKSVLYVNNTKAISIADSCNGLELYVLYIAFLICLPTSLKRQLAFAVVGVLVIFILNAFRCFGLAWLFLNNYTWANFAHHYIFKMIIYGLMFYTWIVYSKNKFLDG